MAKTYLDQLVEYPAEVMQRISEDKTCVGLLLNKGFSKVTEDDFETALEKNLFDYQYVDDTTEEVAAYIFVEAEVSSVSNKNIKGLRLYVTVVCHKSFMKLNGRIFQGVIGNRRDNLVRYVDSLLNGETFLGIGALNLRTVKSVSSPANFTGRLLTYEISDFNIVDIKR